MLNLFSLNDLYIIVPSTVFFLCLFQEYFSFKNINKFFQLYPRIVIALKILGMVLIISLVFYLFIDVAYAMSPEDLPKRDLKVTITPHFFFDFVSPFVFGIFLFYHDFYITYFLVFLRSHFEPHPDGSRP